MNPYLDPAYASVNEPASGGAYCATPGANWLAETLRAGYCGVAEVFGVGRDTAVGVTGNAVAGWDAVTENAATGAADVSDNLSEVSLFGLGLGLSAGGIVATAAVAGVGAFAVDQLLLGGTYTRRITGRRR